MSGAFDELHRRPRRTVPAVVTALILALLAAWAAWSATYRLLTNRWPVPTERLLASLGTSAWTSPLGWASGAGLLVVGVIAVMAGGAPGPFRTATLRRETHPDVRIGAAFLARSGLLRLADSFVAQIDGVEKVDVSLAGRRLRVAVRTTLSDTSGLRSTVRATLTRQLDDAGVTPVPRISVRAKRRGGRA